MIRFLSLELIYDVCSSYVCFYHHLINRVVSMVQQYAAGLNACSRFFDLVSANWQQFLQIFGATGEKLTRHTFRGLFVTDWSPEGSNDREEEEETIFHYDDWLVKVEGGLIHLILNCTSMIDRWGRGSLIYLSVSISIYIFISLIDKSKVASFV